MSQVKGENQGMLRGEVLAVPKLSHHNHGVDYYLVPFRVPRLSGAEDVVNLVVSQPQAELWQPGNWLEVGGEVRSYNNRSGQGSRLVITLFARSLRPAEGEHANDLSLAGRLCRAGSDHRKFIRQILVSMDITAPLYWWKEFDTYKVGTVANSTSTMHKIHAKPFERADFSTDHMTPATLDKMDSLIEYLEGLRLQYVETKDKALWYDIIQLLPSSYNQMRTCTLNYENLINIHRARKAHKLEEWHTFCHWIESLPYADDLIVMKEE